ncbi:MAG: tRNA lysidine(34) synthetase TilS [Microbacterium sp.]|nr:tRNA lysidine(34) synthetase TilS [Microbacterium sp.]
MASADASGAVPVDSAVSGARRPRLTPAIADVRRLVREALASLDDEALPGPVLVALSGGADSTALAAALAFEAPRAGRRAGAIIVDHRLQAGSAEVAATAAARARALGLDPVQVVPVAVEGTGGPEAAARAARYTALRVAAEHHRSPAVLLGHTLDDQAETVLLGLVRGSGSGSLIGMRASTPFRHDPHDPHPSPQWLRPLLGIRRETTRAACADAGLDWWDDPQNADPAFTRVRVRATVLPLLEAELGPGIAEALARTAEQAQEDEAAFAAMIEETIDELVEHAEGGVAIHARALAANPAALRHRIIRHVAAAEFGVSLSRAHTIAIDALATDWHGQRGADAPAVKVVRSGGLLVFTAAHQNAAADDADQAWNDADRAQKE